MDVKFWEKVDRTETCWKWIGAKNRKGYGNLSRNGKYFMAHRYSWMLANGSIPIGKWVLHKCDNPSCVKPDHLFLGNVLVNNQDMWSKGRGVHPDFVGKNNPRAKLTEDNVRCIRKISGLHRIIAKAYGITPSTVSAIKQKRIWKHVSDEKIDNLTREQAEAIRDTFP